MVHGIAQGAIAALQGGNFGAAFLSAAVASGWGSAGIGPKGNSSGAKIGRVMEAAIVGGTVSRIGGGKFANGAVTGAFVQAFNHEGDYGDSDAAAEKSAPEPDKPYSIVVDGRELNPDGVVLGNETLRAEVSKLYSDLTGRLGTDDFQFKVTGGDRYIGADGRTYSSTDNKLMTGSGPAHIRGDAVDLRIKYNDGGLVPVSTVRPSVNNTRLIFDPKAMPNHYPDQHYHLQLPKGWK